MSKASYLDVPLHIDGRGRCALTDEDGHIRDLIQQVLFTEPGERVNRPDFGCGLKRLVFMPNSDIQALATKYLIVGALQRWLEVLINVEQVEVAAKDEELRVTVVYTKLDTGERQVDHFSASGLVLP